MIDKKSVDDMTNILRAMNSPEERLHVLEGEADSDRLSPGASAMKDILTRLYGAEGDEIVHRLTETSETDITLREALQTERTETGARVGKWNIIVKEGDIKTYDVAAADGIVIASDLYLYEAAYGIVKHLNAGSPINSKPIRDLLEIEEQYARVRNDAVTFKKRYKSHREKGDDLRAAISEDRYDEANRQASHLHDEILRLSGLRR